MTTIIRPTPNAERHMVCIKTEKTGRIEMTPEQFDMLLECALVGLDGAPYDGERAKLADELYKVIGLAHWRHTS